MIDITYLRKKTKILTEAPEDTEKNDSLQDSAEDLDPPELGDTNENNAEEDLSKEDDNLDEDSSFDSGGDFGDSSDSGNPVSSSPSEDAKKILESIKDSPFVLSGEIERKNIRINITNMMDRVKSLIETITKIQIEHGSDLHKKIIIHMDNLEQSYKHLSILYNSVSYEDMIKLNIAFNINIEAINLEIKKINNTLKGV